jgi:hypothetical protein
MHFMAVGIFRKTADFEKLNVIYFLLNALHRKRRSGSAVNLQLPGALRIHLPFSLQARSQNCERRPSASS